MLKIGLVGVGGISGAHIPAWNAMEDTTLTAICDIRPERMEPYPEPHHYTSIDEMLEKEELDILDICLPTYLHVPTAVKAMKKGIHVLSEKPISLKEEDIELAYASYFFTLFPFQIEATEIHALQTFYCHKLKSAAPAA